MSFVADTLRLSGLDTLSERALRRLTDRWTGELHPIRTDSLGHAVQGEVPAEAVSEETFNRIINEWRLAREHYHDAAAESLYGSSSTLADGVVRLDVVPAEAADTLTLLPENGAVADSFTLLPEVSDVAGVADVAGVVGVADVTGVADASERMEVMLTPAWWDFAEWTTLLYGVLVVVVIFLYMRCLYRYFDDIATLFGTIFGRNIAPAGRTDERRRSEIFYGSLGKLFMLGAGFVGLLVGIVLLRADVSLADDLQFFMPFVAMVIFLIVVTLQYALLGVVGAVTRSRAEVASLMRIRLTYFVLATVMVAPVMLASLMGNASAYDVWFKVAVVGAGVVIVMFIRESIKFFIQKKVSILHWFLYLCTVEILPLSLLWQAAKILR